MKIGMSSSVQLASYRTVILLKFRFLDYSQHLPPSVTEEVCDRVDAVVASAVESMLLPGALLCPTVLARFRLPIRRRGCGVRSRRWLAPGAFVAGAVSHGM